MVLIGKKKKINFLIIKFTIHLDLPCLKPKISKKNMNNAKLIKNEIFKKIKKKMKFLKLLTKVFSLEIYYMTHI